MQILQIIKIPGLILHLAHIKSGREFTYQYNCLPQEIYRDKSGTSVKIQTQLFILDLQCLRILLVSKLEITLQH